MSLAAAPASETMASRDLQLHPLISPPNQPQCRLSDLAFASLERDAILRECEPSFRCSCDVLLKNWPSCDCPIRSTPIGGDEFRPKTKAGRLARPSEPTRSFHRDPTY